MATLIDMPKLSDTMAVGTLVKWLKNEGDPVESGDMVAEVETDKATMGFETPEEGYLAKIFIEAGTRDIPIGKLLCIIVEEQEDVAKFADFDANSAAEAAAPAAAPAPAPAAAAPAPPHHHHQLLLLPQHLYRGLLLWQEGKFLQAPRPRGLRQRRESICPRSNLALAWTA